MICRSCDGSGNILTTFWNKLEFLSCFNCGGAGVLRFGGFTFGPSEIVIKMPKEKFKGRHIFNLILKS